tara:strand:+ start:106 stop:279 length:174 start_codon:yes stop_codon:yes gene_type:complete
MNKEKLITRIDSEIKKSKYRLDAHNQGKRIEAISFEKGYINALATIKFDIKYCNTLK